MPSLFSSVRQHCGVIRGDVDPPLHERIVQGQLPVVVLHVLHVLRYGVEGRLCAHLVCATDVHPAAGKQGFTRASVSQDVQTRFSA